MRNVTFLITLMAAEFLSAFESSMLLPGLPSWVRIFGDPVKVGWLLTSYILVSAVAAAVCARMGDLYGRKQVLLGVVSLSALGSLIAALNHDLNVVLFGRALQGFAGAIIPLCYGIARENLPPDKLPWAVNLIVSTAVISVGLGVLVGGFVAQTYGPHGVFWVSFGVAGAVLVAVNIVVPRSLSTATGKVDWVGAILLSPGIILLLLTLGNLSKGSPGLLVAGAAAGVTLLLVWARYEWKHPLPLVDLRMLGGRKILFPNLAMLMMALGPYQVSAITALLVGQPRWTGIGLGTSPALTGMLTAAPLLVAMIVSLGATWASYRIGYKNVLIAAAIFGISGYILFALNPNATIVILLASMLGACSVVIAYGAVSSLIIAAAPEDRTSEATGITVVIRSLGQAAGTQIMVVLLASSTVSQSGVAAKFPSPSAFFVTFAVTASIAAIGLFFALLVPNRTQRAAATVAN